MKKAAIFHPPLGVFLMFVMSLFVFCLALTPPQARAQDSYPGPSEKFSREELAQILAPVALYPDPLLSQILMASTYPIEVIEADRWVRRYPELKDEALDRALLDKDWDPSVKAICHFPWILALMSERISETTNLGNAFLAQEAEVMQMIQELRAQAYAQGNLTTNVQQKIIVEKETIIIVPANPRVIYVPCYDPFYIYGPWWYPAYPPYYWCPPGVSIGYGISYWPGFYFSFVFGNWSHFDWHHHHIFFDVHKRPRFVRHDRWIAEPGRWHHAPHHRRGVAYRDKSTAVKYGQSPRQPIDFRRDTRGFPERRDMDLDRDRRIDERTVIDRERRGDERSRLDRQEQQRVDREREMREKTVIDRQKGQVIDRDRQKGQVIDRARQKGQVIDRDRQKGQVIDRDRQERERVEGERQMRRIGTERREQERAERERQQRSRDNVFNQVEDGGRERRSSERGRFSRQDRSGDSRDRGRSDGGDRGGRDDRSRDRR